MKLLIYLIVLFFLLNGFTADKVANSLIRDACKKASRLEEPYYYSLCVTSIQANPESQKAKNIDELIVVGLKNAMSNMTNVNGIVEKIVKEKKYKTRLSEKLLRDCLKLYSDGKHVLPKALEYIKLRKYQDVFDAITKAKAVPRTCEMGFNGDNEQISPVAKENDLLFELMDIPQLFTFDAHMANTV